MPPTPASAPVLPRPEGSRMDRPSVANYGLLVLATFCVAQACVPKTRARAADDPAAIADKLPEPAKVQVEFARDVKPLFAKYCVNCHGPDKQQAGLRLDV